WNTLNARQFHYSHGDAARQLLERVAFVELTPAVLARALEPFPVQVRTLDSLHLASMEYLRGQAQKFALASYDKRLIIAARPLGIEPTEV
ncbi:MAG: hypothetical protein JOZ16_12385, partial [Methylobacteriaceae bacterium]|nr:hypothetical protein [Methylobacteriaceae bacterium]